MKLLEIKNNLAKMSYADEDKLALAQFIALVDNSSSYVGQIVNLKADTASKYAIVKLIFIFNNEGIVDSYDGSIPSVKAQLLKLEAKDILNLLPLERPVTLGRLAHLNTVLKMDETMFEKNLTVCAEKFDNIYNIIKNFVTQLKLYNEKTIIIDIDHTFTEDETIRFKRDFKLPLNSEMIDFIFENDLADADAASRAVIQDIFYEVQEYVKTVQDGFIPFDTFLNVVASQYKQTEIPELALLKNKLLKYQEANIFAQNKEDLDGLKEALEQKQTAYIDTADVPDELQKHLISYIHKVADTINSYTYLFVKLTNKNSDKSLLRQIIDNDHIFTTIICSHSYKYVTELKQRAENIILFTPQTLQHDFAYYNSFLNKLNANEFIVCGALTQNVPFIVELPDEDTEWEDIAPIDENIEKTEEINAETEDKETSEVEIETTPEDVLTELEKFSTEEIPDATDEISEEPAETLEATEDIDIPYSAKEISEEPEVLTKPDEFEDEIPTHDELVEQVAKDVDEVFYNKTEEIPPIDELEESLTEDDLDFLEDLSVENTAETIDEEEPTGDFVPAEEEQLQAEISEEEDAADNFDTIEPQPPVVPVYPAETPVLSEDAPSFEQGDTVIHPKYGKGVIEKLIKYGSKILCSISFENVGRRLLDPAISELTKEE